MRLAILVELGALETEMETIIGKLLVEGETDL